MSCFRRSTSTPTEAAALGVVGFYLLIDAAYALFYHWPSGFLPRESFLAYPPELSADGLATTTTS